MPAKNRHAALPLILYFIALTAVFVIGRTRLTKWNVDPDVLIAGNLFLFVITLISFLIARRGLRNKNPHAFVRSIYAGVMIRLFLCMLAAFGYIAWFKKELNKPALFICMGLYLLYTALEISVLLKMLKAKANG